ncbi:MAG: hypothetical protein J5694_06300, partial [Erysipelotrichaceae bacterium]|nr:hypothetical protein [Erysipelotrichaceae bacterium]
ISYTETEYNSKGAFPFAEEAFYPDGRYAISIYLLAQNEGTYCYSNYEYDKDGNVLIYGYNNSDNSPGYFETNTYENGVLRHQVICDYNNGVQSEIEYKNGAVEWENSWELDRP